VGAGEKSDHITIEANLPVAIKLNVFNYEKYLKT
jgi:hypothetical protein